MKIDQVKIKNFKGVGDEITVKLRDYNCIVGKNDVGKSTIFNAMDLFLNDKDPIIDDKNIFANEDEICMEFYFSCNNVTITIDDVIPTTLENEGLLSEDHYLILKKTWNMTKSKPKSEWCILRKKICRERSSIVETG